MKLCMHCGERRPLDEFARTGGGYLMICDTCNDAPADKPFNMYTSEQLRRIARLASHKKYNQRRRAAGASW